MAVALCAPAVVPRVQVLAARPLASVFTSVGDTEPSPVAKVTATPLTGLPYWSVTWTRSGLARAVSTVAVWLLPSYRAMSVAVSAKAVALKLTGEPVSPAEVAVALCAPAVVPRVQVLADRPLASVLTSVGDTEPSPVAKVTATPETGLPYWSVTWTRIGLARAVPTVAVWLLPSYRVMSLAVSGVTVTLVESSRVSPLAVARTKIVSATWYEMSSKVAIPLTTVRVAVPKRLPVPLCAVMVISVGLSSVTRLLVLSSTRIVKALHV